MEPKTIKGKLATFGRSLAVLFNRTVMYQDDHPVIKQSVEEVHKNAGEIFEKISTLVFILNRNQFYLEEEPLDPSINTAKIAALYKSLGIQSVSFDRGLTANELSIFATLLSARGGSQDADTIKNTLSNKNVSHIKINHVQYKKVAEGDQVVSRDVLKKVTPLMDVEDHKNRKRFMDALIESTLLDEPASLKALLPKPI